MRRRLALALAAVCAVAAVGLAVLPYTGSSQVEFPDAGNEAPDADGNYLHLLRITTVEGRCRPPVVSAWRKDGSDDEGFWAVTVGTDEMGYARADSMGSLCAGSARRRLVGSLGLAVVAAVAVRRRRGPTPPPGPDAG